MKLKFKPEPVNNKLSWMPASLARAAGFSALLMMLLFSNFKAQAAADIWASGSSTSWLTTGNWSLGNYPQSVDYAQFTGGTATTVGIAMSTLSGVYSFQGIEVTSARTHSLTINNSSGTTAGVLTLTGTTINSVANVIIRNNSSQNFTFADGAQTMGLALRNATENIINLDSSGNITISDIISSSSGTTPLTFSGAGSGTITISGTANTFTGTIKIGNGTANAPEVPFAAAGSLGNSANAIIVDGGRLTLSASADISTHAISLGATTGTSISAPSIGTLTYTGVLADKDGSTHGILVKQGTGTLALGGVSTFSGNVSLNNGTLQLTTGNNRLPTGTIVNIGSSGKICVFDLNGENQQIAGLNSQASSANTVSSTAAATLTIGGGGTYTYGGATPGVISGAIGLVMNGAGTQMLGGANTCTGNTTISAGTLALSGLGSISSSPNITIASGGNFDVSGLATALALGSGQTLKASATGANTAGTITMGSSKGLTLSAGGLAFTAYGGGSTATLTVAGAGSLALNGSPVTVTTTAALGANTYKLIAKSGSATVTGTPGTLTVNGVGLGTGTGTPTLAVAAGELILTVPASGSTTPTLTAAAGATVDGAFNVTFTDDATWRSAITGITVNGTTLIAGYSVSAGQITFTPSASVPASLLQSSGTKSIAVQATGYSDATVSQPIAFGAAVKLGIATQPAAPSVNGGTLATQPVVAVQDQYGNTVTSSSAAITAAAVQGTWTLGGTLLAGASSGVATFAGLTATDSGAVSGATIDFTSSPLIHVTSIGFNIPGPAPAISEVFLPQYIQGGLSTNGKRVPYACRVTLYNLNPNTTYNYINGVVISSDGATANGAGNAIYVTSPGAFVRSGGPSLASAGNYGTFTTDGSGSYTGWFITEPTGNSTRFATAGTQVYVRIILNDGAGGTVNTTFLTTADYATVIVFGTTASSTTQGTGIYGASSATAKNFVLLYDNTSGTGRPISGTLVEDDGVTVPIGSSGYASFYTNYVDGVNGSWGCIIPNSLANGVRRIEQRANSDGSLVGYNTESVGIWPSSVNTVNPSGSDGTPLVISSTPLTVNGITVPNLAYTNAPGIARIISLADIQTAGLTSSLASPSYSITGVNSPISAAGTVIYNASNIKYTNSTAITSPGSDSFSYTVSDGASSASGTVTINFGSNVAVGPQLTPRSDGSSHAVVSFHGLPGYSYHIQRATTLGPPADWTNAAPITLSPTGDGFYIWTNTISPADGFYRLSYP